MQAIGWSLYPISDFKTHTNQWDQLNNETTSTPLLNSNFVVPLLKHFGTGNEKIAVYRTDNSVQAMAIIVQARFGFWHTFQPSQAPLGCWIQKTDSSTESLTQSLRKKLGLASLALSITQQDPELLIEPTQSSQFITLPYIETARVTVKGSFEEYWAKRGKNLRQNLRKQRNRLEREGVTTRLVKLTSPSEMLSAIEAYGKLEDAGWKSELNTAISADNEQGRFYTDMLTNFAEKGNAIVFQFWYNDDLVATDLCIMDNSSIIILKTTYDENIKISSPALLLKQDAFEYIFENKLVERIEFYGKVMEWHTKWSDEIRTMYHINAYSKMATLLKKLKP